MTQTPDHHCPGCGAAQKAFPRYPWYFCKDCLLLACDQDGRTLRFGNVSLSGGLEFRYADDDTRYACGTVLCLIKDRPVLVREARFGGVVAEPIGSGPVAATPYHLVDVRRGLPDNAEPVKRPRSGGTIGRGRA